MGPRIQQRKEKKRNRSEQRNGMVNSCELRRVEAASKVIHIELASAPTGLLRTVTAAVNMTVRLKPSFCSTDAGCLQKRDDSDSAHRTIPGRCIALNCTTGQTEESAAVHEYALANFLVMNASCVGADSGQQGFAVAPTCICIPHPILRRPQRMFKMQSGSAVRNVPNF